MLDFIHLSATGVAEIAKSTNLKGCPHSFVYIVYVNEPVNPPTIVFHIAPSFTEWCSTYTAKQQYSCNTITVFTRSEFVIIYYSIRMNILYFISLVEA